LFRDFVGSGPGNIESKPPKSRPGRAFHRGDFSPGVTAQANKSAPFRWQGPNLSAAATEIQTWDARIRIHAAAEKLDVMARRVARHA
jgi:hypothetical protein